MHRSQVKTRMQLETGKSKNGLVGTLRNIIKEEGYVSQLEPSKLIHGLTKGFSVGRLYRGKDASRLWYRKYVTERTTRTGPSFITRGTQACC